MPRQQASPEKKEVKAKPMSKSSVKPRVLQLLAVGAAALLAGCSMIPKYERPAAPIADQWPATAGIATGAMQAQPAGGGAATPVVAAADIEWQTFFRDPK